MSVLRDRCGDAVRYYWLVMMILMIGGTGMRMIGMPVDALGMVCVGSVFVRVRQIFKKVVNSVRRGGGKKKNEERDDS